MNLYQSPEALALRWQRQAEISYESGHRPLFGLGIHALQAESILALLALRRWEQRRPARIDPIFIVGGEGDLWLLATLLAQPPSTTLYAGSDLATHAASLNLHTAWSVRPGDRALPAGMAWMMTPTAAPGSEQSDLETLPFALAEEQFVPVAAPETPSWAQTTWLDVVDTWAALLLALALLVAAWWV